MTNGMTWARRLMVAAAFMCGLLVAAPAWSQQTAPAMLYSYTKVNIGNSVQRVVMPRASSRMQVPVGAPLSPAIVNGVFKALRKDKSTTYGDTELSVDKRALDRGTVTVKIDKSRERYFPIISSEVVYTMTQLGLKSVSFPGYSKKAMTRADVAFAAFRLVVPVWRALPPVQVPTAVFIFPDGSEMTSAEFAAKVKSRDPVIQKMVETYLKGKDAAIKMVAIRAIPGLNLADAPSLLMPLLRDKAKEVRLAALEALAGNEDEKVLDAISGVMDRDKDKAVALKASEILGKSRNKKYSVRALYFALRGEDEAASLKAIEALVKSKEGSVGPELVKSVKGKREKVAAAAIEALGSLKLTDALVGLFKDAKLAKGLRLASAAQVASIGATKQKFEALALHAEIGDAAQAAAALVKLKAFKDPDPRQAIEKALSHPAKEVRHQSARLLAEIRNPESLKALAAAGTRAEDVEIIQEVASTIMAKLTLQEVLQYTNNRNIVLKRVAYRALGVKGSNSGAVFDALAKGVKSKDEGIRAASALALGSFKNDKALKQILTVKEDTAGIVRRDVARALGNWPAGTETEILMNYLSDNEGEVVEASVSSLHKRAEDGAYKPILKLTRGKAHPHPGVRKATLRALVDLAPRKELQTVISVLTGGVFDKDREVKILAIELLGRYDNPAAVTGLAALINDPVEEYRVKSLLALGATQSNDAIELIASVVNDQSPVVRSAALEALGKLGKKKGAEIIRARIALETDKEVIKAGEAALRKLR